LSDVVVLDFTRVLAGPHCTRTMADLGARIIKIERPGEGDEMRRAPLRLSGDGDQSSYFARRNAGKESVAIDMSKQSGRELVFELARHADVAIENFVPGVASKLGCDYETLRQAREDLVYCSISGYGQTGPDARQGAFAHVIAAASGIMYLDAGEQQPHTYHAQTADVLAGSNAFGAIVAALYQRHTTRKGAHIDVSMLESLIASEDLAYASVPNGGPANAGPRTSMGLSKVDGRWIAWQIGGAPMLWPRLCEAMGQPELTSDPRYATPEVRRENWPELQGTVAEWLRSLGGLDEALERLRAARIPCALVMSPEEVVDSAQMRAREAFVDIPHRGHGSVRVSASPYWIDGRPVHPSAEAPYRIGEHTHSVLTELLGLEPDAIRALQEQQIIATPAMDS
jgi:crotonobetainyl-CoA:carnitine CoA-transferase CaiB-like acyl-CoA transferase